MPLQLLDGGASALCPNSCSIQKESEYLLSIVLPFKLLCVTNGSDVSDSSLSSLDSCVCVARTDWIKLVIPVTALLAGLAERGLGDEVFAPQFLGK